MHSANADPAAAAAADARVRDRWAPAVPDRNLPSRRQLGSPVVTRLIADLLTDRARRTGAEPLITYYDLGSDERTAERRISGATYGSVPTTFAATSCDICAVCSSGRERMSMANPKSITFT